MIKPSRIKQLDPQNVYSSIRHLPSQIKQVVSDFKDLTFTDKYQKANKLVIAGMGGSIYNYYVIVSLFSDRLKIPCLKVNGYQLPATIDEKTLFIGSSYSGSTEETIYSTKQAIKNRCLVTAVTSGGRLASLMRKNKLTFYQFDPKHNPCRQPRVGLGYTIFAPLMILHRLNYLRLNQTGLMRSLNLLNQNDDRIQQKANKIKEKIKERLIIFVAAEHLAANAHIARNQINETAKTFAEYHLIPELNHHLMEGLTYPKNKKLIFVFFNSNFYLKRNNQRIEITKKVLKKQKIDNLDIKFNAKDKMEEFLLLLQFNSYLSFFLAMDYGVNPSLIPWVDYFKKELV